MPRLARYKLTDHRTIGILIIERAGRRPLMIWAAVAQGFTMAILAGLYETVDRGNKAAQGVSVLMLFLFNTEFSIGWLGMTWLYPAEVTPLRIRAPANACPLPPTGTGSSTSLVSHVSRA